MAADTVNQKVFVPLSGVLKLQDEIRRIEGFIDARKDGFNESLLKERQHALRQTVEFLGLPIEVRHFSR